MPALVSPRVNIPGVGSSMRRIEKYPACAAQIHAAMFMARSRLATFSG